MYKSSIKCKDQTIIFKTKKAPPLDHLSFKVIFDPPAHCGQRKHRLALEALINGKPVLSGVALPVDILELVASAIHPGNYFIWTCTCGVPECAGIYKGVHVEYSHHAVTWTSEDAALSNVNGIEFDRAHYMAAVDGLWRDYVAHNYSGKYAKRTLVAIQAIEDAMPAI